jgi:hypothetical protein
MSASVGEDMDRVKIGIRALQIVLLLAMAQPTQQLGHTHATISSARAFVQSVAGRLSE